MSKESTINFKPLGDRVLVSPVEQKETKVGNIIIPDTSKEKPLEGEVVAIGDGKSTSSDCKSSESHALSVKIGDKVLFTKWGGTEIKINNKDYLIMKESDILGIYTK